ncbi:Kef-type K+ transport system membrane component KefB [Anaerosolibacter carboniphilus]|uniref:Kef-type K+ transport system membrane component KefB n=1 Tax=Anaerosolibacter carboniphilus TaxID=1417629 RepID=A0A841KTX8_9FIRM|nr:cation:proton antiporter [Anaerosolibacter carboniphilus]MBB6215618.1 Kef-type K+ transport system membrane component KefB [Anaerosolibacter carboniphilus]
MESKMLFLLQIGILLLGANFGGWVSARLKQPAVLGQILVGVILGMGIIKETELIHHISEIGVIFLMFIAGLETDVEELKASKSSSSAIALGGVLLPLVMVSGAAYLITGKMVSSIFLGIVSTATSVSISVQTLRELGHLRTKQGVGILGAAIIDDIIGIILLTVMIGMVKPSAGSNVLIVLLKIAAFFAITFFIGTVLVKMLRRVSKAINLNDKIVVYAIVCCFVLAFVSEELGVAAITGAYFAGVILSLTPYHHKISYDIQLVAYSFFTPIFFVGIGLGVHLGSLGHALGFGVLLLVLGIIGKIVGCGLGAKLTGFNNRHAFQIGIGMIPRAEVAIIIANLGLQMDIIGSDDFTSVILLVIVTTLITPSLLKLAFREEKKELVVEGS